MAGLARNDFTRTLKGIFPDHKHAIELMDDDQIRSLFDRVRIRLGMQWKTDTDPWIDVDAVAEGVAPKDLEE